jgi:hypothetical protein
MKDYLNKIETSQFMVMNSVLQSVLGIINTGVDGPKLKTMREDWAKRGNLTKEEHRYLKMTETYMEKAVMSIYNRLSPKQQEQIQKKLFKYQFQLVDEYTFQKMSRDAQDKIQYAVMLRPQFYDWCDEIMQVKCNGCTKDWNTCDLHQVFDYNFVPESGFDCTNCKYAYSLKEEE